MPEFITPTKASSISVALWIFAGLVVLVLAYVLFFAPVDGPPVLFPSSVNTITELSKLQFDPSNVVGSDAFKSLRIYSPAKSINVSGRPNPFLPF